MDKKTMIAKYNNAVKGIAAKNGVDMGVAGDMFIHNAHTIAAAAKLKGKDWYNGTGIVNVDQLITDINAYDAAVKNTAAPKEKGGK